MVCEVQETEAIGVRYCRGASSETLWTGSIVVLVVPIMVEDINNDLVVLVIGLLSLRD